MSRMIKCHLLIPEQPDPKESSNCAREPEYGPAQSILAFLLLAVTALLCIMPLFLHKSLMVSHDINFHIFQSAQFYQSICSGTLCPKWVLDSNNGYGSANFIFYSPLGYYVVSLFHLFIPSTLDSMIVAIWSSFFFSGASMFVTVKKMAGFSAALLSAVLYQIFPFHVFDLYLRGTLAELFAFAWFPMIMLFLKEMTETRNRRAAVGLSISYAALILTHLVSGFIFTIVIILYLIFITCKHVDWKKILSIIGSLMLGLGLSSFFLIPLVYERKFIQIGYVFNYAFSDFKENFLFLPNNLRGEPGWFYIPVHVMVVLELGLFLFMLSFMYAKKRSTTEKMSNQFFIYLFLFAFFMATPLSRWAWNLSPGLKTIQFPWRWIVVMELSLIYLMINYFVDINWSSCLHGCLKNRLILYLTSLLILISIITMYKGTEEIPKDELNRILEPAKAGYYTNLPKEYTPVWANDLEKLLKLPVPERVSIFSGKADVKVSVWQPEKRIIYVDVFSPAVLRVATFYYPGWEANIDAKRTEIAREKNTDTMLVDVPKGSHVLTLEFVDTPLRHLAKLISLLFCLIIFTIIVHIEVNKNKDAGKIKSVLNSIYC